jgi:predicted amidohydrolase YtcJ
MRPTHPGGSRLLIRALLLLLPLLPYTGCARVEPADLVLLGGHVVTVDAARPETQAVAVTGYRITAVGSDSRIRHYIGPDTEVIDLQGRLAVPGFIDGHGHYLSVGNALTILDLTKARTWDDIVALVAETAAKTARGEWITGRGWHQEKWDRVPQPNVDGVPLNRELNRVAPDHPVLLEHASGHASIANATALRLAGITRRTPDPPGGEIVKDARGEPTGLLRETAQRLVAGVLTRAQEQRSPAEQEAQFRNEIALAGRDALSKGVTSFHDAGSSFATIDLFRKMAAEGTLPIRLNVMVRYATNEEMDRRLPDYRILPEGNAFLTVHAIKRQIDGALGAHGAWLLEPYEDLPTSTGLNLEPVADIARTCEIALKYGFQVCTHAIGDRANREVLDIYERAMRTAPEKTDLRWRIEHAQHLAPADVPRFRQLGVVAAMQAIHCTSDGPWVLKRLGEKRAKEESYLWRTLTDLGVVIGNGTDCPVEDMDPIPCFYAAVTRHMPDGEVFYGEQRLTRAEALRTYTLNNAFAAFEEDIKGSLTPGKLADITVLSVDIMTCPEDRIRDAKADLTILGGRIAYRRNGGE